MFYAPPEKHMAKVYARLPEHLKWQEGSLNDWVAGQPLGNPDRSLLEGPSFGPDGQLYCVDIINGRVLRIDARGGFDTVAQYDGWPNGLKFHRDGRAFIADYKHGIMQLDLDTGRVTPVLERYRAERFKGVNDLFFSASGDLYFTDQGLTGWQDPTGRLFKLNAQGDLQCLLDNIPSPNGLVMDLEEAAIYLAVTRANAVWKVPLMRDGSIGKVGTFVQLSGGGGPDGLAMDENGGLYIAHVGMGCVWGVDKYGEPSVRIVSPEHRHTTNMAFGGPQGKTLYITESSSATILAAELDVAGKPMFLPQPT